MDSNTLFTMALGLGKEWTVKQSRFEGEPKRLELSLDFAAGQKFACPECGQLCPVHDTVEKRWRHLNFFQYECELVFHGVHGVSPRLLTFSDLFIFLCVHCSQIFYSNPLPFHAPVFDYINLAAAACFRNTLKDSPTSAATSFQPPASMEIDPL